jgi:hypothetical protein
MKNIINGFKEWYSGLSGKKHHVEFITAVLTVPVLLTVIIVNLSNLNQQKNAAKKQPETEKTTPIQIIITGGEKQSVKDEVPTPRVTQPENNLSTTPVACIKEVGTVSILSPRENEVVVKDPVCITIAMESNYCSVVRSYRLDDGSWSDFSEKNICLYNLTNGNKILQLKLRSTASSDEVTLQRSFIYQGNSEPTSDPKATSSAGLL